MTKTFELGMLSTGCYVVNCRDTLEAVIIDPGFDNQTELAEIISYIESNRLDLKFIVNTHGHPDHTSGNEAIKERFHVPIAIHKDDAYMLGDSGKDTARYFGYNSVSPAADILLQDGDYVTFGDIVLRVVHTPGHSFGSVVYLGETEIFAGDTLFAGSIGRTDFPGSSDREMQVSLKKLVQLPDYFVVYPGHGPQTTIGEEKRVNPFLQSL
jgi:glyoxylase-like metal-dependent hydrolase (beta-lactamase superfamily II)